MATASFRSGAVGRGGVKADTITNRTSSINSAPKSSFKSKSSAPPQNSGLRRNSTGSVATSTKERGGVSGRVRVAVRLRPRNAEEMVADTDFADCVELQPELKRLNLRRNNWDTDTYEFDEVLTEFASQKRVYEAVAKPVVENVLDGYNGTVMAYGQTGTGKTYTLGRLGEEDTADRGIMVRAMEDILAEISLVTETVSVSYLQLYMESIQDLLDPANGNVSIVEDPKTGDISLPGATVMEIRDQKSFLDLLQLGEAHRIAANTILNTESSRSHAILMVHVKRSVKGRDSALSTEHGPSHLAKTFKQPVVRRSKLAVVDLAGSERISKSGSEAHTLEEAKSINLSLTALGKCINALAENSNHVPVRDSKLTRLLRDSFGGTARTSLVITIGPSPRHRGETASTIMFGKRAMKVENMLKTKEEFDYKGLSRRLDIQLDKLIAEHESQQKAFQDEIERIAQEAQKRISEAERNHDVLLESERMKYEKEYLDAIQKLEQQWETSQGKHEKVGVNDSNNTEKFNQEPNDLGVTEDIAEIKRLLQNETLLRKAAEEEISDLKNQIAQWQRSEARRNLDGGGTTELPSDLDSPLPLICQQLRDSEEEKASMEKLFEQVGLQKILSLLESEDADVRIHAVKVLANLAAEVTNQVKIVKAGGLTSLLAILRSSSDETIHRVAAGALANLAMNETNQELIMSQGGIRLLSVTATNAQDPQTLRMVAGAIANLCGNDKLQIKLRGEGGIRALVGMVKCKHPDVLAQVARGIANFAKCESRAYIQGTKSGKSLLIEDGAMPWIIQNASNEASHIRRHIELALCHIAQHEVNAKDMISGGALWELVRISRNCSREDIRTLAYHTLTSSKSFQAELKRLRVDYG
ncbi:kinesin-like protein KIN-UA isoform X3 [Ipomoea triloba]|uniref:kinesin-like protein KIN-UA isoform X3 n=1 Tax=Ipomoea triloba TaxID=35885 RepID=UPI00125CDB6D|nr:kinesin-like protein KIN-UA isoform X3 [Ipomoea triloba]